MSDQPAPTSPFSLRWRLLGIRFCIMPSFWLVSAFWGFLFAGPFRSHNWKFDRTLLLTILLWVACTLVSVIIHELGHVVMGRVFKQPGNITLAGLGGQATGNYDYLSHKERILVAFAGPAAGFLFLGVLILIDFNQWNLRSAEWFGLNLRSPWCLADHFDWQFRFHRAYFDVMYFLFIMNLFWNLINLIPIIPMDGGIIFREICCIISPQGGLRFAYACSFLLAGTATVYHLVLLLISMGVISLPFTLPSLIFPILGVIMFGMMAYQCFQALRTITTVQRRSQYADTFDD